MLQCFTYLPGLMAATAAQTSLEIRIKGTSLLTESTQSPVTTTATTSSSVSDQLQQYTHTPYHHKAHVSTHRHKPHTQHDQSIKQLSKSIRYKWGIVCIWDVQFCCICVYWCRCKGHVCKCSSVLTQIKFDWIQQ